MDVAECPLKTPDQGGFGDWPCDFGHGDICSHASCFISSKLGQQAGIETDVTH